MQVIVARKIKAPVVMLYWATEYRHYIAPKQDPRKNTVILSLLSQRMERIWRRLQHWIIIKMMCSVW